MAGDGSSTNAVLNVILVVMAACVVGPAVITLAIMKLAVAADPERSRRFKPRRERIDSMMLIAIKTELAVRRWWRYHRYQPRHSRLRSVQV